MGCGRGTAMANRTRIEKTDEGKGVTNNLQKLIKVLWKRGVKRRNCFMGYL